MAVRTTRSRARTVLVVGGGGSDSHVADWSARTVRAAHRRDVALEVADRPQELAPLREARAVLTWELDFRDTEAVVRLAEARAAAATEALAAVVSFRELGVHPAASAAERIGLAWNPVRSVATVRRKDRSRMRLRAAGLTQPDSRTFATAEEAIAFLRGAAGQWVVKPSSSLGSQGVSVVAGPDEAEGAVRNAAGFDPPILVEELVAGEEFSAEGVFVGGRPHIVGLTHKRLGPAPYFVSFGHVMPAALDQHVRDRAAESVLVALAAVGLTHSPFHVELWVTDGGEVVIGELHARPGGDWIHRLVEEAHGIDLFDAAIADLVGDPVDSLVPEAVGAAATAAVIAERPGVLQEIAGVDEVRHDPRCVVVDVKGRPGHRYGPPTSHYDRLALVVARGGNPASAEQAAHELADRLVPRLT